MTRLTMDAHTIDTASARQMAHDHAIRGARIVGESGGWSVVIRTAKTQQPLGAQRTGKPRSWASLDTCVRYLRDELGIVQIELDASGSGGSGAGNHSHRRRPDTSERMKRAHEAATYDAWFRSQVQEALNESGQGIPHEQVKAKFAAKRAALRNRAP